MLYDEIKEIFTGNRVRNSQAEANLVKLGVVTSICLDPYSKVYNGMVNISLTGEMEGTSFNNVIFPHMLTSTGTGQIIYPEVGQQVAFTFADGTTPIVIAVYTKDFLSRFGKLGFNKQLLDAQGKPVATDEEFPYKPVKIPSIGSTALYGENIDVKIGQTLDINVYKDQDTGITVGNKVLKVQLGTNLSNFNENSLLSNLDDSNIIANVSNPTFSLSLTENGSLVLDSNKKIVSDINNVNTLKAEGWHINVGVDNKLEILNKNGDVLSISPDSYRISNKENSNITITKEGIDIHFSSGTNINLVNDNISIVNKSNNSVKISSDQVSVGIGLKEQPMVFGSDLKALLLNLIDVFNNHTHNQGTYVANLSNGIVSGLSGIPTTTQEYEDILTTKN